MKSVAHSLYWRVAALYLLLLLLFSAVSILLAGREFEGFLGEVEQRLNRDLAAHLAQELADELAASNAQEAQYAAKRLRQINPSIDMYLLSAEGRVRTAFTGKPVQRHQVDVAPLRQFIERDARLPIRAVDPGVAKGEKVFSVAALNRSSGGGYLYVILPGMPFESAAHMVRTSYILRGSAAVLAAVLLATFVAGLLLFDVVTRRFRRLTMTVKKFQEGAFNERAEVAAPHDQIGRLASTFNEMAATIETQFLALKQTDEARRVLATNISHDFRTPLTALRGYTDRLIRAEGRLDPSQRRQHLDAVMKSAAQLEHLADQLAIIVQLDGSSDYKDKMESFSIAELAQDAVLRFMPIAEGAGISLALINPEDVPNVVGDIALIERALANLIDNALKNTAAAGRIEIRLPIADNRVSVIVKDNGCGIPAEELPFLTQRFYRTTGSRGSHVPGTGLGLAIVDDIVQRHAGRLEVESFLTKGTTVTFSLPIAEDRDR